MTQLEASRMVDHWAAASLSAETQVLEALFRLDGKTRISMLMVVEMERESVLHSIVRIE
jgi:hypothetical protein